jgi:transposase
VAANNQFFLLCACAHNRKNWMFSNTAKGAEASAVLYSLIETAKSNGLIPFDYLHHILKELGEGKTSTEDLLPWNVSL